MSTPPESPAIQFLDADESWKSRIAGFSQWGESASRHMHFEDGFSILAVQGDLLAGYISVYWKNLPEPLADTLEAYIDILEVHPACRRQGIARSLIELAVERARGKGAWQLRSWSSLDKLEAIPMWKALKFCLCPAVTYPRGEEVRGLFVARLLDE